MAGFVQRGKNSEADQVANATVSSLTLAVGDLLELDAGATTWTVADSATENWQRKAVCLDSATSSETLVRVMFVNSQQLWEVDAANNSDAADNGDRMLLTDKNTVNNTGTDNTSEEAVVIQEGVIKEAADSQILVRFSNSTGINPDAS